MGSPRDRSQMGLFQSTKDTTGWVQWLRRCWKEGRARSCRPHRLWQELRVRTNGDREAQKASKRRVTRPGLVSVERLA